MKKLIIIIGMLLIPVFAFAEITKTTEVGEIKVQKNGVMNVQYVTIISENGEVLVTKSKMAQFVPGQDVSEEPQKVQDMAATVWTDDVIAQYESDQTGDPLTLDQQKAIKTRQLYTNIKKFVNTLANGYPRYDDDLKLGIMNAIMEYNLAGQPVPQKLSDAKTWLQTVQRLFVIKKNEIANAETQEALDAIDVSISTLELQYGRNGTILPDPGVSTADLAAQ